MDELLMERYALAKERVCEIKEEKAVQMPYLDFFQKTAAFLEKNVEIMDGVVFLGETREPRKLADAADLSIDEWKELNRDLYADILPENYRNSYGNPVYACEKLGEYGKDFSFLYAELRGIVVYAFEKRLWDITVLLELFLEVYGAFAQEEVPTEEELRGILNSYANDYCQDMIEWTRSWILRQKLSCVLIFQTFVTCICLENTLQRMNLEWLHFLTVFPRKKSIPAQEPIRRATVWDL